MFRFDILFGINFIARNKLFQKFSERKQKPKMGKRKSAAQKARHNAKKEERLRALFREHNLKAPPNLTESQRHKWLKEQKQVLKEHQRGKKDPNYFRFTENQKNVLANLEFYCKENLKDLAHMKPDDWLPKSKNYKSDENGSIEREFSWFARKVERLKQNEALQESRMKSNYEQNSFGKNSKEFILQNKKDKYTARNVNKAILHKREKLPAYHSVRKREKCVH